MVPDLNVKHRRISVDGVDTFYREAGRPDAPVVLLPHGYPCSSYAFRNLMPCLADRWRLLAPDFPGAGLSDTPQGFDYSFDGYAAFLAAFCRAKGVHRCVIYLHDFGSQIGLRLAILEPRLIDGLIVQNGDIYEDTLGPRYAGLKTYWKNPSPINYQVLRKAVNPDAFRDEFLNDVEPSFAERIPPELWILHWSLMTEQRQRIAARLIAGLRENREWFPRYQAYLRQRQPPTLVVWGPQDGYMPEAAGRAYLRDLPRAEVHMVQGGGHWLLETHLDETCSLIRDFLGRMPA